MPTNIEKKYRSNTIFRKVIRYTNKNVFNHYNMGDKIFQCILCICIGAAIYCLFYIDNGTQLFIWFIVCFFVVLPILGFIGCFCEKLNDTTSIKQINPTIKKSTINSESNDKVIAAANKSKNEIDSCFNGCSVNTPVLNNVKNNNNLKVNSKENKYSNTNKVVSTLYCITKEQRYALLKVAVDFCYCSPERNYLLTGQYELLLEFVKILKLEETHLITYIRQKWFMFGGNNTNVNNLNHYEIAKTIHQDEIFLQFIYICNKLLELLDSLDSEQLKVEYYAYLVYPELLKEIGFTQEEADKIVKGENIYRFERKRKEAEVQKGKINSCTSTAEDHPVSKEQMAIFKKNWTIPQFRKEFGTENVIRQKVNYSTSEIYKVCIFIKGSGTQEQKTEVGFSNSIGDLTIQDIQKRERELMIGLSESDNYKLYDKKLSVWKKLDI